MYRTEISIADIKKTMVTREGGGNKWEIGIDIYILCCCSVTQLCLTGCNPMDSAQEASPSQGYYPTI